MKNRIELRDYIRYQLMQLSARNGAHEFELLCFALARLRHVSNLQPATGPVQAGGDQGRDFETYHTYLKSSELSQSSFISMASPNVVVGACTLERQNIQGKVRYDLSIMFDSGVRPDHVIYFCEQDVPVGRRHQLEEHCRSTYNAELSLHDGAAIADQLADPDTFWIAEQFLSVSPDLFPSDVGDNDYQKRRNRWLDERTKRIEDKIDGLKRDEKAEERRRRWEYMKQAYFRSLNIFFALKSEVGLDWLVEALKDTIIDFNRDQTGKDRPSSTSSLGSLIEEARGYNLERDYDENKRPQCAFWEIYKNEPGYWVCKRARISRKFEVVAGFEIQIPWAALMVDGVERLGDLASLNEIHISIPPRMYFPGIDDFVIDFVGDSFSFTVALSDHGLGFLHEMAHTHHAIAKEVTLGSIGTGFGGVQLLEMFLSQLDPPAHYRRKGVWLFGLPGPEGRLITFYPKQPPGFDNTSDAADYLYKVTLPGGPTPDSPESLKDLEQIVSQKPIDFRPYGELAARYSRLGRLTDCISCLERAIKHATPSAAIHGLLGETFAEIGRIEEASVQFNKAAELEPESAAAHSGLGICLRHLDKSDDAVLHLRRAVSLEPRNWQFNANLGFTLASTEKYDEAILSFEQAIEIQPNEVDLWMRLGWLFEIEEKYDEALARFEHAIQVKPDCADAYEHAARMLQKLDRCEESTTALRKAIELEETAQRQLELGDAHVRLSQWPLAEVAFSRALQLGEDDAPVRFAVAISMVNQQKYVEAAAALQTLLQLKPGHEQARQLLSELGQKLGTATI